MILMLESVLEPELNYFSKTDSSSSSNHSTKEIYSSRFKFWKYKENWLKII